MRKVLLIGAHSYISNMFEQYINKNMIDLYIDKVSASDNKWRLTDLSEYDTVVMLSAIVHRKERKEMENLYIDVNCKLPIEIAEKSKHAGVKQFIFLSTAAVYGSKVISINKYTAPHPDTMYGSSKYNAENKLLELQDKRFHIAIIRPPMIYGENCKGNYNRLAKLAKYNPIYPQIHNKRSMLHIDTMCNFLNEVIQDNKEGIFLPQDKDYADTIEIIKKIRKEQGKKTILVPGTAWLISLLIKKSSTINKLFGNWYYE
jgi:UDP-glucose 4-epimerase